MKISHSSPIAKSVNILNLVCVTLSGATHADKSLVSVALNLSASLDLTALTNRQNVDFTFFHLLKFVKILNLIRYVVRSLAR